MKNNYQELDDAICLHISQQRKSHPIYSEKLAGIASKALGRTYTYGDDQEWRLIDRRMQALKKAGRILYKRPDWAIA